MAGAPEKKVQQLPLAANADDKVPNVSPLSQEIVIGLVGYAGAGCSTAAKRLIPLLQQRGYKVEKVRLSGLISAHFPETKIPVPDEGLDAGKDKLTRAIMLQDLGDRLRSAQGDYSVASLAIKEIMRLRGDGAAGGAKRAFIIESIKHSTEVELLRKVYGESFRLIAVHCERANREARLIGPEASTEKYAGADEQLVRVYMNRDEDDSGNVHGQHVRNAFYIADYFVDNNLKSQNGENLTKDINRFASLMLGEGLVRPTVDEKAIYHAHAASMQSSCLSRQVGAVLVSETGEVIATGTNDAPKFGGGVYSEGASPDHRCHAWVWDPKGEKFVGCHNDRKKDQLRQSVASWLADNVSGDIAEFIYQLGPDQLQLNQSEREKARGKIREFFENNSSFVSNLPGIKDIIEYSRAIHAEMDALLSAARSGVSTLNSTLYCTTYPCHNCARHLVAAGVGRVFYVEPYVKSLAIELHSDAITNELPGRVSTGSGGKSTGASPRMAIAPFTGVGPRMYDDFFSKKVPLKGIGGKYLSPVASVPSVAVRLRELGDVEKAAADLVV